MELGVSLVDVCSVLLVLLSEDVDEVDACELIWDVLVLLERDMGVCVDVVARASGSKRRQEYRQLRHSQGTLQ